ncbi:hypothetical protein ILUMI_03634, partial [Ignelater luminosus]
RFFGNNIRSMDEVERTMSLLISNNDPLVDYSRPLPPNIIPVAGIHIQSVKKLPKDIEKILNEATHGVVLVAFGTNLKWNSFAEIQRQAFSETFKRLPQTILMKSSDLNINISENVIIRKWLPQSDILAHPNVKLFITHGGALSIQEAMYHGVPVVGMPFYLDQHGNTFRIEARKLGRKINYPEATFDVVYNTITDVLNDSTYRNNMQDVAKKFKDQPQAPLERAVFWTEYVLRHGNVDHLSPTSRDMPIFHRFDLDILAVFLTISFVSSFIFYNLLVCFKRYISAKPNKNSLKVKLN